MTEHRRFETLNDYALGRLDDAAERAVEAHIDACEACLEAVRDVLRAQVRFYDAPVPASAPAARSAFMPFAPGTTRASIRSSLA